MLHERLLESINESKDVRRNRVFEHLQQVLGIHDDEKATGEVRKYMRNNFFAPYSKFWKECGRGREKFLKKCESWLQKEINLPDVTYRCLPGSSDADSGKRGRPPKDFAESLGSSKR